MQFHKRDKKIRALFPTLITKNKCNIFNQWIVQFRFSGFLVYSNIHETKYVHFLLIFEIDSRIITPPYVSFRYLKRYKI